MSTQIICFSAKIKIKGLSILSIQQIQKKDCLINCHISKQIIEHAPNIFIPKNVKFSHNLVDLSDFVIDNNKKQLIERENRQYAIFIGTQNKPLNFHQLFLKNYQCLLLKKLPSIVRVTLKSSLSLSFLFHLIDRPKFAKTIKLQNLLSGHDNQNTGILTMDQSGRFLVQSLSCQFPAVGIWVRSNSIDDVGVYMRICHFLTKKVGKMFTKLALGWEKKSCIAFVRINENEVPQLYLVSWKQNILPQQGEDVINQYELKQDKETIIQFNKQNLQFTLRGNHPHQKQIKQIDYISPIKDSEKNKLQEQLQKIHLQQSPQFSSIKKHHWLQQRGFLLEKIQNQDEQIKKLKRQIQKLTSQLIKARNINSSSQKPLALFRSPTVLGSGSSFLNSEQGHSKLKKLSSNDLQLSNQKANINLNVKIFESGSTKERASQNNQSNSGSGSSQFHQKQSQNTNGLLNQNQNRNKNYKQTKIFQIEQDPWDMMQIIQ